MRALFVNGYEPACGVAQYGKNLYAILSESTQIQWDYCEPRTLGELKSATTLPVPDVVVYNYQSGMGGFLYDAPFSFLKKQVLIFHDCRVDEQKWDAILFSDPTMTPYGKWRVIGRPLPKFKPEKRDDSGVRLVSPVVGVHGFIGAWADQVVYRVSQEFEHATVRLSLPFATYGDRDGAAALSMAERCRNMMANHPGITLQIQHDLMSPEALLAWLHRNDLNCYIRPADMPWRGVSSAPDFALAANRPIAINRCHAFRHLHQCRPSICIEDSSLTDIFANGLSPLVAFKASWCDPEVIRHQVEEVLFGLE